MNRILAIFSKEVRNYFLSPIAYVVMTGFAVLSSLAFYYHVASFPEILEAAYKQGALDVIKQNRINHFIIAPFMEEIGFILIFLIPVLTMRLFSEEKRSRTDELLLTSPVTVNQIVIAKYLAGLFFTLLLIFMTMAQMAFLFHYSEPDLGATFTTYLSLVLYAACTVSIGLFTSSLTENQIVASVSCLIVQLLLAMLGAAANSVGSPVLSDILSYLSLQPHMKSFLDGVIISQDLVYFLSFAFLFLFLTNRSVESSRWR